MAIDWNSLAIPKQTRRFREKQNKRREEANILRELRLYVFQRDSYCCRACKRFINPNAMGVLNRPHLHHIKYRSRGGMDTKENTCALCPQCHHDVHDAKLRITGDAELRDQQGKLAGLTIERLTESGWKVERVG